MQRQKNNVKKPSTPDGQGPLSSDEEFSGTTKYESVRTSSTYPDTAMLQENTSLEPSTALRYYSQEGRDGAVLMFYYMTSCTLLEGPSEITIAPKWGEAVGLRDNAKSKPQQLVDNMLQLAKQ
jgi:hypothetical protein